MNCLFPVVTLWIELKSLSLFFHTLVNCNPAFLLYGVTGAVIAQVACKEEHIKWTVTGLLHLSCFAVFFFCNILIFICCLCEHQVSSLVKGYNNLICAFLCLQFSQFWGYSGMVYQPIYTYSKIPFELLLPRGPEFVRLPSVIWSLAGILTTSSMLWLSLPHTQSVVRWSAVLTAAGLLSISPWHHHFSRLAFEVISMPTITTAAIAVLLQSVPDMTHQQSVTYKEIKTTLPWLFFFGCVLLGVSAYTYPTARAFAPALFVGFLLSFELPWLCKPRQLAGAGLAFFGVLSPIILSVLWSGDSMTKHGMEWARRNIVFTTDFEELRTYSQGLQWLSTVRIWN